MNSLLQPRAGLAQLGYVSNKQMPHLKHITNLHWQRASDWRSEGHVFDPHKPQAFLICSRLHFAVLLHHLCLNLCPHWGWLWTLSTQLAIPIVRDTSASAIFLNFWVIEVVQEWCDFSIWRMKITKPRHPLQLVDIQHIARSRLTGLSIPEKGPGRGSFNSMS